MQPYQPGEHTLSNGLTCSDNDSRLELHAAAYLEEDLIAAHGVLFDPMGKVEGRVDGVRAMAVSATHAMFCVAIEDGVACYQKADATSAGAPKRNQIDASVESLTDEVAALSVTRPPFCTVGSVAKLGERATDGQGEPKIADAKVTKVECGKLTVKLTGAKGQLARLLRKGDDVRLSFSD